MWTVSREGLQRRLATATWTAGATGPAGDRQRARPDRGRPHRARGAPRPLRVAVTTGRSHNHLQPAENEHASPARLHRPNCCAATASSPEHHSCTPPPPDTTLPRSAQPGWFCPTPNATCPRMPARHLPSGQPAEPGHTATPSSTSSKGPPWRWRIGWPPQRAGSAPPTVRAATNHAALGWRRRRHRGRPARRPGRRLLAGPPPGIVRSRPSTTATAADTPFVADGRHIVPRAGTRLRRAAALLKSSHEHPHRQHRRAGHNDGDGLEVRGRRGLVDAERIACSDPHRTLRGRRAIDAGGAAVLPDSWRARASGVRRDRAGEFAPDERLAYPARIRTTAWWPPPGQRQQLLSKRATSPCAAAGPRPRSRSECVRPTRRQLSCGWPALMRRPPPGRHTVRRVAGRPDDFGPWVLRMCWTRPCRMRSGSTFSATAALRGDLPGYPDLRGQSGLPLSTRQPARGRAGLRLAVELARQRGPTAPTERGGRRSAAVWRTVATFAARAEFSTARLSRARRCSTRCHGVLATDCNPVRLPRPMPFFLARPWRDADEPGRAARGTAAERGPCPRRHGGSPAHGPIAI